MIHNVAVNNSCHCDKKVNRNQKPNASEMGDVSVADTVVFMLSCVCTI